MDVVYIWKQGHQALLSAVDELTPADWELPVLPMLSLKNVVQSLTLTEQVLGEVLGTVLYDDPTPLLERCLTDHMQFNSEEIAKRQTQTPDELLDEYSSAHIRVLDLLEKVPEERWQERGILPWYSAELTLQDFVVLFLYEHKRDYVAKIESYRYRLGRQRLAVQETPITEPVFG